MNILKNLKIVISIFTLVLTILIYYINLFPDIKTVTICDYKSLPFPFNKDETWYDVCVNWFYPNKNNLPIILCVIIITIQISTFFFENVVLKRILLDKVLSNIIESDFFVGILHSRITVFKKYSGIRSLFLYIWFCFIVNFSAHKKIGLFNIYLKHIPNPTRQYLFLYRRRGIPNQKSSSVNFLVPRNEEELNGIVSYSILYEMFFCSKLPSLEGIDLDNYHCYDELEKKSDEVTTIKDYMEKSKMNDFDRLKMIHKNFTNIAASPLYRNDKIWGAVVVDNDFEGAISKKQERIIITYFKIIEKLI